MTATQAAKLISDRLPNFKPKCGIVLGSGLGDLANELENTTVFDYKDLPGFPVPSVQGHAGKLIAGELAGVPIVCLQGRAHRYEGDNGDAVKTYVRTLKHLGCDIFIASNAAGSLREECKPGSLVLVHDHINMQPSNPLIGPNDDDYGPRFLPLDDAYCPKLRATFSECADELNLNLPEGVYCAVVGPMYETAAEIRAFKTLGADVIGMSTVPEVIVARHCGMRVAVISSVTNYATGLADVSHSHDEVVKVAAQAAASLTTLVKAFVVKCA